MKTFLSSWSSQGLTGVRFFLGIGMPMDYTPASGWSWVGGRTPQATDGNYSHPWDSNGNVVSTWSSNLLLFFQDVASVSPNMAVTPSLALDTGVSGDIPANLGNALITNSATTACDDANSPLMFFPWLPFGYRTTTTTIGLAGEMDCKGINAAYSQWASSNPQFWGWGPFESMVNTIISNIRTAGLPIREFEIQQEVNFFYFTTQARLIYDNKHSFDVLGFVRSALGSDGGKVTLSGGLSNLEQGQSDCGSLYGDSAMLILTSEFTGAVAGAPNGGLFGVPNNQGFTGALPCYSSGVTTDGMISLPPGVSYSQPSVVDIHAYPCWLDPSNLSNCLQNTDATSEATNVYNDVWSYLSFRGLTSDVAIFGESSIVGYNCTDLHVPPSGTGAYWNVNGYIASSLYSNHSGSTVFQPFNNLTDSCYSNPVTVNPPYNSQ